MVDFDFETREHVGINAYLGHLAPASPYGREALAEAAPYTSADKLLEELDNIAVMMEKRELFPAMRGILGQMKNIDRSLSKPEEYVFEHIEIFEIRKLLFLLEKLRAVLSGISLAGISIPDFASALEVLDPDGKRSPGYYIGGPQWPELESARRRKALAVNEDERLAAWQDEDREEERVRRIISEKLHPMCGDILNTAHAAGKIDLLCEKARVAEELGCVKPQISEKISFKAMRNPRFFKSAEEFTPLDIDLLPGSTVITGANMGGKSVALSTAALCCWLSQSGFYPPAAAAEFVMLDGFHMLWDRGTKSSNLSSFAGEMHALDKMVKAASCGRHLILADELARGTNPAEGAKIAAGATAYLNTLDSFSVITTHYDNVAPEANAHYRASSVRKYAENCTSPEQLFSYGLFKCAPDESCPRDALTICEFLKVDERIMSYIRNNYDTSDS